MRGGPSKPEQEVASAVRELGLAFSTDDAVPCGEKSNGQTRHCVPDLLFRAQWVAIFIDGCYWHRCPEHATEAGAAAIRKKDSSITDGLTASGWHVMRFWEHDDLKAVAAQIVDTVLERQATFKAVHTLAQLCPHRRRDSWCDYCQDSPHSFTPDELDSYCRRCGISRDDHDEYIMDAVLDEVEALGADMSLVALRRRHGLHVRNSELNELAEMAKRVIKQVSFLSAPLET